MLSRAAGRYWRRNIFISPKCPLWISERATQTPPLENGTKRNALNKPEIKQTNGRFVCIDLSYICCLPRCVGLIFYFMLQIKMTQQTTSQHLCCTLMILEWCICRRQTHVWEQKSSRGKTRPDIVWLWGQWGTFSLPGGHSACDLYSESDNKSPSSAPLIGQSLSSVVGCMWTGNHTDRQALITFHTDWEQREFWEERILRDTLHPCLNCFLLLTSFMKSILCHGKSR